MPKLSRRAFLSAVGASSGAVALGAMLPESLAAAPRLRVGVVLPRVSRAPNLGPHLLRGLGLALAAPGMPQVSLTTRWYEKGQREALDQVRELVEGGAALVVGAMSRHEAQQIAPLLSERGVPLLITDVGASIQRKSHPFIFRSSLGHWQGAWALGQWAATNIGRRALIASSFYDSGYDTVHAFWGGFEQAGGELPSLVVTGGPGEEPDLLAAARAARPDFVFAAYSGPAATRFVRGYAAAGLGGLPLLGSGTLTADDLLSAQSSAALGIRSAHSWDAGRPAAQAFVASYLAAHGSTPDAFAALGYDAGSQILAAVARAGSRPSTLRDALVATALEGVRGPLAFSAEAQETAPAQALREVRRGSSGPAHITVADLTALAQRPIALASGPRSGWTHAFLMV
jgi:branched-chain amino acid transport system substrate-binding protein